MPSDVEIHDVIQIGYGPVGQTHAALLGQMGHDVAVFERHAGLYALPRAGHIDHEIMRVFQTIGCVEAIERDIFRCSSYGWRNQHGQTLIDIDWGQDSVSGWASDYLMYQPYVEDALDAAVRRHRNVAVHHGWQAVSFGAHRDFVEVTLARGKLDEEGRCRLSNETRRVRGRYLIGADGANSFVRTAAGLALEDLGFREQWLVTDFRQKHSLKFDFDNGQICDPERPMCLFQLGRTHRRFEFMVLPGEDGQALASPEKVWSLVKRWIGPQDAELIRATIYTFKSANAELWRTGRALLIGDAAHLMPPFLGQGMCSGIRDAMGLSWKLDLVLRGLARDTLLDMHTVERKPHVANIIEQAVALGRVSCTIDPLAARQRDEAFLSGQVPPPPPFPTLDHGVLQKNASPAVAKLVGRLGPQNLVRKDGKAAHADDIVGSGWHLVCRKDVLQNLSGRSHDIMRALNIRVLDFAPSSVNRFEDITGAYNAYFSETGVNAILVRPDFYIFGALEANDTLDNLLGDLTIQLGLKPPLAS